MSKNAWSPRDCRSGLAPGCVQSRPRLGYFASSKSISSSAPCNRKRNRPPSRPDEDAKVKREAVEAIGHGQDVFDGSAEPVQLNQFLHAAVVAGAKLCVHRIH